MINTHWFGYLIPIHNYNYLLLIKNILLYSVDKNLNHCIFVVFYVSKCSCLIIGTHSVLSTSSVHGLTLNQYLDYYNTTLLSVVLQQQHNFLVPQIKKKLFFYQINDC